MAIRTPLTKAFKGGFKDTGLDYMVYALLKKVAEESKLDLSVVEDICLGNVSGCSFTVFVNVFVDKDDRSLMASPLTLSGPPCSQLAFHTQLGPLLSIDSALRVSRLFKILQIRLAWEA